MSRCHATHPTLAPALAKRFSRVEKKLDFGVVDSARTRIHGLERSHSISTNGHECAQMSTRMWKSVRALMSDAQAFNRRSRTALACGSRAHTCV
eukprot:349782-Chlamydomonas_euryale.AAC.1